MRAYRLMWNFTLGALLVRAGASTEGPSQQRELRGAPDASRFPALAAAASAWTERDTYREDLAALIDALLPRSPNATIEADAASLFREVVRPPAEDPARRIAVVPSGSAFSARPGDQPWLAKKRRRSQS